MKKYRRWMGMFVLCVLVILMINIVVNKTVSSASTQKPKEKCYKSIEIEHGDSLWSIAKEYYTEDWDDLDSFMEEIQNFNGITSEAIHAGNYLAIPYYK